jgi:hypothetical protein
MNDVAWTVPDIRLFPQALSRHQPLTLPRVLSIYLRLWIFLFAGISSAFSTTSVTRSGVTGAKLTHRTYDRQGRLASRTDEQARPSLTATIPAGEFTKSSIPAARKLAPAMSNTLGGPMAISSKSSTNSTPPPHRAPLATHGVLMVA